MIIKELVLTNFGKFHNKTITLNKGFNIVYGENEAGKTTIHTFIRGMLFGIEKKRGRASEGDTYSNYEPWENPSEFSGMMRIEKGGVNYRLERVFNKDNKSFKIINEDDGIELTKAQIDELFTGLDENSYYNTISVSQLGSATDKELEYILKNYAANLAETKSMDIDIQKAYDQLNDKKKILIAQADVKAEDSIRREIRNLYEDLEVSEAEQKEILSQIEENRLEEKELIRKIDETRELDSKRYEEMARVSERKENLYQDAMEIRDDLDKIQDNYTRIKEHQANLVSNLSGKGVLDQDDMNILSAKAINDARFPLVGIFFMMACIGMGVGILIGDRPRISDVGTWIIPGTLFVLAALFLAVSIVIFVFRKKRKKKKLEEIKDLRQEYEKLEAANTEEQYAKRQMENKKEELARVESVIKTEEEKELQSEDYTDVLDELQKELGVVRERISKSQWIIEQKREADFDKENRIEDLQEKIGLIEEAKVEIDAIEAATKGIQDIAEEIRLSFGKKLNDKASYYIEKITDGKYNKLSIDEKLKISINGKHSLIPSFRLSKGTMEQIYMALRLAAADIIFGQDKKPMLLDDAFVMYDNKRMGNTLKFMANQMEQTILFSCHTREIVMADKLGLNYELIKL